MNNKIIKKIFTYGICLCMAFSSSSIFADENNSTSGTKDWSKVEWKSGQTLNLTEYNINDGQKIDIPSDISNLTIVGDSGKTYKGLIIGGGSSDIKLTIQDLKINNGYIDMAQGESTLYLKGENSITAPVDKAAIYVQSGKTLTINAEDIKSKLIVNGGSSGAGIGASDKDGGTGNVIIKNGTIVATGGTGAAGIGQGAKGNNSTNGTIQIQGGVITAIGGNGAAGIGASNQLPIGDITISGGVVTATGGNGAAGIGAAAKKASDIKITGGAKVIAIGGAGGAGIGGGNASEGSVGNITINNATINAHGGTDGGTGGAGGAGIGGGCQSAFNKIEISQSSGKTVIEEAIGGYGSSGIGSGSKTGGTGACEIVIDGGTIAKATGGIGGAGIGGGNQRGANIVIKGDAIIEEAIGGNGAAGIGSGPEGEVKTITIAGKSLIKLAQGGENAAGIGGGDTRSAIINITGGNIELAKGGANGAGIGCGAGTNASSPITISGGVIYAVGGSGLNTNDIGAANYYDVKNGKTQNDAKGVKVTITGGTILLGNNRVIGKDTTTHTNYMVVGYETYPSVKMSNKKIYWRTKDNAKTKGELSSDAEGRTTFILESDINKIKNRDYWFVVVENEGQPTEKSYIGLLAEDDPKKWITTYYDDSNNIVTEATAKYSVKEIPIQYHEAVIGSPVVQTVAPKGEGNKVIPYATSNIGYSINFSDMKTADPRITDFVKVTGEIEIVPDDAPGKKDVKVEFLTSKASGGVAKKTSPSTQYVNDYKDSSKFIFTAGATDGANMKFECIGNWIASGDYQVVAYVPTEGLTDNTCASGENLALDQYKTNYVTAAYKMKFKITEIKVTVKWKTYQSYTPVGGGDPIIIDGPIEEKDIPLNDTFIEVQFYDIPKIN